MFEDALMESAHRIKTRSKYWSIVSLVVDSAVVIALVVWPLLHPQALPTQVMASLLVAPPPPLTSQAPPVVKPQSQSRPPGIEVQAPSRIPHSTTMVADSALLPAAVIGPQGISNSTSDSSLNGIFAGMGAGRPVVQPAPAQRARISSGIMQGNLLEKITPQYPAIARAARIQGTVVLQATIGKTGTIQNLSVVSGPPMLRQAALDAVRSWRYKPYLLNGEPVDVETTVNVVFNLGN